MNRLALTFAFLIFQTSFTFSQLVEENFDYPAGDSIGAHGWVNFSGGATNRIVVTSPGLTFPDYSGSGIGNATEILNTGQDSYIPFISNQTTGSIYASMLVRVDTAKSGDYFAAFLTSTSTNNFYARLYSKMSVNGNIAFGISKTTAAAGGIFYGDSIYNLGTTYLLVLKYVLVPGSTNDSVSLYVFSTPAPSLEPVPAIGPVTGTAADPADLGRFALRQGTSSSSPNLHIDGILVSTFWDNSLLPVELSSFYSTVNSREVNLNWSTNSETNNYGFEIERTCLNGLSNQWVKIGFVTGHGTVSVQQNYSFSDKGLASGRYKYRLRQIDFNGNSNYFEAENELIIANPEKVLLHQNYPNPFNPETRIDFDLPYSADIRISIIDIAGKEVSILSKGMMEAGFHSVNFNASAFSSGVYYCKMTAIADGNKTLAFVKLVVLK